MKYILLVNTTYSCVPVSWDFASRAIVKLTHILKNTDGNKLCEQFLSLAGNSLHFKSSLHSFQIQPSKSDYADHI